MSEGVITGNALHKAQQNKRKSS